MMECQAFLSQLHRALVMGIQKGELRVLKGRLKGKLKGTRQICKGRPG